MYNLASHLVSFFRLLLFLFIVFVVVVVVVVEYLSM